MLFVLRPLLDKSHVALALLLVVLGASADGGKRVGIGTALAAFLVFDFVFLPPYYTLSLRDPFDWLVLAVFLATSAVAAHLFDRLQRETREARARTAELRRLATLGAEALNAAPAARALEAVAAVIRETLPVSRCTIRRAGAAGDDDTLVAAAVSQRVLLAVLPDGTTRLGRSASVGEAQALLDATPVARLLVPLLVRDRCDGVLDLADARGFTCDEPARRYLDVLSYYAALGVERVRLEAESAHVEALREADRLKDALIASVSHDLRTPLTTIKALAHALRDLGDERPEIIEQEADRLNRFVGELLDLSRLSAGAVRLTIEVVPVDELVTAAVQQVEGALRGRRLAVSLGPDSPLLVARFDLVHAARVVVNLIENALKYAPPDSPIDLSVGRRGPWVDVVVADRGPGVAPEERERIFEPLYRPAGAPTDAGSAGLGLAIARQLAEAQGGSLSYAPRLGGGSVFTLSLPAAALGENRTADA